jgi:hypothetical protein
MNWNKFIFPWSKFIPGLTIFETWSAKLKMSEQHHWQVRKLGFLFIQQEVNLYIIYTNVTQVDHITDNCEFVMNSKTTKSKSKRQDLDFKTWFPFCLVAIGS